MDQVEYRCSSCGSLGGVDFMSKSQRKKSAEKRRCTSCVDGTLQPASINTFKAANQKPITTPPSPTSSPLQKSLLLFNASKPNGLNANKRKFEMVEEDETKTEATAETLPREVSETNIVNGDRQGHLSQLIRIYQKYNHDNYKKVSRLNRLLDKFEGKEDVLFRLVHKKYGSSDIKKVGLKKENYREIDAKLSSVEPLISLPASKTVQASSKCDKCDGNHRTDACPHFKKSRDNHPDAQKRKAGADIGGCGGNVVVSKGKVVSQPGDGSCLFHSMAFGLKQIGISAGGARTLRREIADFLKSHPNTPICSTPISSWVKWDSGMNVQKYCSRMAHGGWGGGIELAGCSLLKRVNVHVYERIRRGGYKRISCFDCPGVGQDKTIYVLYCGGMHYDAFFLDPADISRIASMKKTSQRVMDDRENRPSKKVRMEFSSPSPLTSEKHHLQQPSAYCPKGYDNKLSKKQKKKFGLKAGRQCFGGNFGFMKQPQRLRAF